MNEDNFEMNVPAGGIVLSAAALDAFANLLRKSTVSTDVLSADKQPATTKRTKKQRGSAAVPINRTGATLQRAARTAD